jgi:carbonic anhydrase/acetyltransferase-like protein (isoleucine patch superfamily)
MQAIRKALRKLYLRLVYRLATNPLKVAEYWRKRGMQVGANTHIFRDVHFGNGGRDPIIIGRNCVLTACTLLGHDASTNRLLGMTRSMIRPVLIEDDCFIGRGAIVLMGVTVGRGSIVGAGAVVTTDVPPGSVVAGNPARVICTVTELVERRRRLAREHPECFPSPPREGAGVST